MLEEAERENLLVTGLIYIDTSRPTLLDGFNLVETPLNRLGDADLRPARETIDKINAMMF
jgi:2-oxoglutarate ferredoxin oxidoreductase subunit beta